jgi:hypothetical protein
MTDGEVAVAVGVEMSVSSDQVWSSRSVVGRITGIEIGNQM